MTKPEEGFVTKARVIRIIDGDTYEVEITRRFPIRLQDERMYVDTAEQNTKHGPKATEFIINLLAGKEVTIFIPAHKSETLMDFNSFNRILAQVWLGDKKVVDILDENGYLIRKLKKQTKEEENIK